MSLSRAPVSDALAALVSRGALAEDPNQSLAAGVLDRIALELADEPGFLGGLFGRKGVRGAYLVGEVGRGKTLLMDLFFAAVPLREKRRLHFHEFMDEVHAAITEFRTLSRGKGDDADPVAAVTRPIVRDFRLICLDEFQVGDIANAMLLGRLFERLFAGGVTLVATSNTPPDRLYWEGLNRHRFVPFIEMLKQHVDVVPLSGATDYRRQKFEGQAVYHFGTGPAVRAAMDRLWLRLTGGVAGKPAEVESLGRRIPVPRAAMGAARFDFSDICEKPLGARDYLRLAHAFDTFVIDRVPQFDRTRTDASKRFILLVDTLYDRGVKLGASFAAPLDELGRDDKTAAEFARTASRLIEMQSAAYLAAARKTAGIAVDGATTIY